MVKLQIPIVGRIKGLPSFCSVLTIGYLVSAVADKNDEALVQDLVDALNQHSDFSRIHPYDDRGVLMQGTDRLDLLPRIPSILPIDFD